MRNIFIFPEISSLTSNQCPCSYIMSCTYVTTFNKCFNLVVKPANSIILYNMSKTISNMQDIQQQQMFSYILLKRCYQFGSFKLGVAFGLFNCMYTLYLKYKSKNWIFSNPNEFVSTK